ncbi:rCG31434 [Rattus norvegicus]|uniref:RCG31434 n=1 Tax=Rattus norvegicus TaxID=10116 RepID=A6ISR3_RAT|nr:rCG31434 [Rattus norvegicus]
MPPVSALESRGKRRARRRSAPVLAEEVCKEGASKEKPESETPPPALAASARTTAR